jgi:hypothetical protein
MASIFSDDDNYDIDQGYRGKNQFWFVLQAPDKKDNGGEWNGEPNGLGLNNTPIGNFEICNATYIGAGTNTTGGRALISRVFAAPKVFNSIFTEFNLGVNIDNDSAVHFTNGLAKFQNNLLWNFASNGVAQPYGQNGTANWVLTNAANSNMFMDPMLGKISRTNDPAFQLDPRPQSGSPALTGASSVPSGGFYTPVTYKGAFKDINWAADWGFAAESCLFTGAGAGTPPSVLVVVAPTLGVSSGGGNISITCSSQSGVNYQVQSSTVLPAVSWLDEGSPQPGTGGTLNFSIPIGGGAKYFRVVAQ